MDIKLGESSIGKMRRISRLFSPVTNRTLIIPLDDALITGPAQGLEQLGSKIEKIIKNPPDAIIGFPGLFRNYANLLSKVPGILNLTASTIRSQHTKKIVIGSVNRALMLGMDAVAVHVNISSKFEPEMLKTLGNIAHECDCLGMPLLAIMYPRSESNGVDDNYEKTKQKDRLEYARLVAHAARIGAQLGADMIKTQYTGDPESFRFVIESCDPVPVVIAGGPAVAISSMLEMAYGAISAGAAGISFGRNVFSRADPQPYIRALKAVVHEGATPQEAADKVVITS